MLVTWFPAIKSTMTAAFFYFKNDCVLADPSEKIIAWLFDEMPVYCLRGTQYETVQDERVYLNVRIVEAMEIQDDDVAMESDCIRGMASGHEFDSTGWR